MSFALFPIVMFLKINAGQSVREKNDYGSVASIQDWNFRFELWFNVLSFISKIPLQVRRPLCPLSALPPCLPAPPLYPHAPD